MERKYLSGNIRERLQDLMKERKITQSELAAKIGMDVSTLSRFISNATGKLGDENIKKIAKEFEVSTDFLLGVTDIPDRMNYDIAELGLSVQAAKNLYTGKVNAEVVNRLLENKNFAAMTNMIAHYFDDTLAAGYAAQNQMYATLSALLMGEAKQHPEDREAITEAAKTVSVSRMPMYQADLTAIQNTFMNVLKEIKKEIGSNVSDAQAMSKEAAQHMYAELTKGQDVTKPNITPEMVAEAITGSVSGMEGVDPEALKQFYKYHSEYKEDESLGLEVHDKSYLEKYDGDNLLWSVSISDFWIEDYSIVSDGVIAYGRTDTWSSTQISHAWMAKIDLDGNLVWKHMLNNGFDDEYIASVLENADGSYAVISRGDLKYFCLSQYTVDGKETYFHKTEVGNYGIWNAARFEDGYMVQLGSYMTNEHAKIVKVDREGNITESFSYGDEDSYYYITDMIEYNGNIYLSAYAVPRLANEDQSAGGRYEIAGVLNYLFDNNIWEISSDELTPMVRDNYTAMLLVCEPNAGKPQEYYSVNGSLGGKLSVSDTGNLLWDVESITSTFFSPATSSFTIGGTSYVFRYTFDTSGMLISQEKTGEVVNYRR